MIEKWLVLMWTASMLAIGCALNAGAIETHCIDAHGERIVEVPFNAQPSPVRSYIEPTNTKKKDWISKTGDWCKEKKDNHPRIWNVAKFTSKTAMWTFGVFAAFRK